MGAPTRLNKIREPFAIGGDVVMTMNYFAGPASYTTGGDPITAKDLGLTWILSVAVAIADSADRTAYAVFAAGGEPVQQILLLIASLAGVEVANASNQSTKKFRIIAKGLY